MTNKTPHIKISVDVTAKLIHVQSQATYDGVSKSVSLECPVGEYTTMSSLEDMITRLVKSQLNHVTVSDPAPPIFLNSSDEENTQRYLDWMRNRPVVEFLHS